MLWLPHGVMVVLACSIRDTRNHRIALRSRHQPIRCQQSFTYANMTGSTSRVVVLPSREVYRIRTTRCSAIASSSADLMGRADAGGVFTQTRPAS